MAWSPLLTPAAAVIHSHRMWLNNTKTPHTHLTPKEVTGAIAWFSLWRHERGSSAHGKVAVRECEEGSASPTRRARPKIRPKPCAHAYLPGANGNQDAAVKQYGEVLIASTQPAMSARSGMLLHPSYFVRTCGPTIARQYGGHQRGGVYRTLKQSDCQRWQGEAST